MEVVKLKETVEEKVKRELKEIDERINEELDRIEKDSIIDEDFFKTINYLHESLDRIERELPILLGEAKKLNRCDM